MLSLKITKSLCKLLSLIVISGETIEIESNVNGVRLLEGLEFLYEDGNFRFGVEPEVLTRDVIRIEMIDEPNSKCQSFIFKLITTIGG